MPLTKAMLSDQLASDRGDLAEVPADATQAFRDKYVSVMSEFRAGQLRSHGNHVVKDVSEAKAMAAEQATRLGTSNENK
jgi:hypothetical protein